MKTARCLVLPSDANKRLRHYRRLWIAMLVAGSMQVPAAARQPWPSISLPDNVRTYAIADDLVIDGVATRIQGFVSSTAAAELADQFRRTLGSPHVVTPSARGVVLGRALAGHYLTVQLEPVGRGARGWIAQTRLKTSYGEYREAKAGIERQLSRFPSGSRMVNHMTSNDAGKMATHMIVTNANSQSLNIARIKSMMQADGLQLEKEMPGNAANVSGGRGSTLLFKGSGREATAKVYQDHAGKTLVLLNTVIYSGGVK